MNEFELIQNYFQKLSKNTPGSLNLNDDVFFDKNKNILKIINIGRYVDQKDQLTLLKALNLIKSKVNFKAVIMGRGIKKREMEIFIRKNNLYNKAPYLL